MFGNILHHAHVEPFQQGHTPGKALLEVDLSTHGTLCDGPYLGTYAIAFCQFIDTLGLYQRGVHIETDQAAHAAEHIILLEREVDLHLLREPHELRLHLLTVGRFATQGELDAGTRMFAWILDALTTCQPKDGVDIQSLIGKDTCSTFYLACLQLTT